MAETIVERQAEQKEKAVAYYSEIPIFRHAAAFAGVSEETIRLWCKDDPEFQARLQEGKAKFVAKYGKKARPEFMLERLDPEHFRETKRIEVVNPIGLMVKKFELDIIEGEVVDEQNDGDVQVSSPENTQVGLE